MQMPEIDGIQLAIEIRKLRPDLPIVLLSSVGEGGKEAESGGALFDAYLVKPVKPSNVFAVVQEVLGGELATDERAATVFESDEPIGKTHPLRILLAEDNAVHQAVALGMLGKLGYTADVAGAAAAALFERLRPETGR